MGFVCAVNRHFVELVVGGELGCGKQRAFVHTACGVTPFGLSLPAHFPIAALPAGVEQIQRTGDCAVFCQPADVGIGCGGGVAAGAGALPHFFGCQNGVEIASAGGGFLIKRAGFVLLPLCGEAASQPVLPCGVVLQLGRHGADDACQFCPVLLAQCGAGKPFKLVGGELAAFGIAVIR